MILFLSDERRSLFEGPNANDYFIPERFTTRASEINMMAMTPTDTTCIRPSLQEDVMLSQPARRLSTQGTSFFDDIVEELPDLLLDREFIPTTPFSQELIKAYSPDANE